ncbi:MAG: VOC family protein [Acidimicrobiales bacterium]
MPKIDQYEPGTPSWVDLASPDLPASVSFYRDLFEWEPDDQGPDAGGYTIFRMGGEPISGAGPVMMEGQPTAWTTYVSVSDADAAVAKAKEAGAMVFVEPMDVMDVGRMAVFADPTGAVIAVWQPKAHKGAGIVGEPGALCWNELASRDTTAASAFYRSVFGWDAASTDIGDMEYFEWKLGDNTVGGMMPMPAEVPAEVPSYWLAYFAVADCDASVAKASDSGAGVTVPPTDIPVGRFAVLNDPQGAMFGVIQLKST